jgi:hypothetical protein
MLKRFTFVYQKKRNPMKKTITILGLCAILLSACSQYTCPTYTKAPEKITKETHI